MKICVTLPPCSLIRVHKDIFAQILQTNSHLKQRKTSKILIPFGVTHKRRLHHKELGAVRSLSGDMAVVCAFFVTRS